MKQWAALKAGLKTGWVGGRVPSGQACCQELVGCSADEIEMLVSSSIWSSIYSCALPARGLGYRR